jgi:hypothetical protein
MNTKDGIMQDQQYKVTPSFLIKQFQARMISFSPPKNSYQALRLNIYYNLLMSIADKDSSFAH